MTKGWKGESKRHALASFGVKTADTKTYIENMRRMREQKERKARKPRKKSKKQMEEEERQIDEIRFKNQEELKRLAIESTKKYQSGDISYDEWEKQYGIISNASKKISKYDTPYEQNAFMKNVNDALNGVNRLDYYYEVGDYDNIRGYGEK